MSHRVCDPTFEEDMPDAKIQNANKINKNDPNQFNNNNEIKKSMNTDNDTVTTRIYIIINMLIEKIQRYILCTCTQLGN